MSTHKVQVRLSRLLLTSPEEIITIANDMKLIPNFIECEDGMTKREYKIELTNAKDYSKEEVKRMFNGNKMISRWTHSLEDGIEKLIIIID